MVRTRDEKEIAQRQFILNHSAAFSPMKRESIYDCEHIFPQLEPILDYLAHFRSYHEENISVDGGAALCGPPGMGKTTFARYIASVSGAIFINVREFPVEIKNGTQLWQPKDVISLFRLCPQLVQKEDKPIVLFIDQFDDFLKAVSDEVKSHFELELDGFLTRGDGIFLLVTCKNMPKVEPSKDATEGEFFGGALFRKGRIGTHIPFSRPDFAQSLKMFRGFIDEHPHASLIDMESLVHVLRDPTAADIKYAVSEARQLARREALRAHAKGELILKAEITEDHLIEVFLAKTLDKETGHTLTSEERYGACVHELGHYLVARFLGLPARFVSVRPGLRTLGITFSNDDSKDISHEDLRRDIAFAAGSWVAEKLCGIPENVGKIADLEVAHEIAEQLVMLGDRTYLKAHQFLRVDREQHEGCSIQMSTKVLVAMENDINRIMCTAVKLAKKALRFFGRTGLENLAHVLAKKPHGVMLQKELDTFLEPKLSAFQRAHKIVDRLRPRTIA